MDITEYKDFEVLINEAAKIEITPKVKTFFDISGFPHYENVISNILAFFFDTNEEHGLRDLWLKSLLECYNQKANTNYTAGEFDEIEREHSTENKKRLDIIISLDNAIVAIENKIYASPYNDFDSYHKEILKKREELFKERSGEQHIIEILLSLKKENDKKTKNNAAFYNITYEMLINQVQKNLGNYIGNANEKWLLFMKDFLNNIDNLGEGDNMDKDWQKFLKESEEGVSSFLDKYSKDIDSKISFIKNLEQGVIESINDDRVKIGTHNTQNNRSFNGYISLFIDIPKGDNNTLVIEPFIVRSKPAYLVIELWNRSNKQYIWSEEMTLLKKDFPDSKQQRDGDWGNCLWLEKLDFEEGIDQDALIHKIVNIYKVIKS